MSPDDESNVDTHTGQLSYRPPNGCLQYQEGLTGTIKTFNFDASSTEYQHLGSQSYAHCIRQEEGYCCVQYQVIFKIINLG